MHDLLTRASGAARTLDKTARTVECVALSGLAPAVRPGPAPDGTRSAWVEELDARGADLSQLGPALIDHVPSVRAAIGAVQGARVDGDRIVCTVRFDSSPEADALIGKIEAGSVRGVSLGYTTQRRAKVGTTPAGLPIFRASAWTPVELSFTPLPVDPGATVRSHGATMTTTTATASDDPGATTTTTTATNDNAIATRAQTNAAIRSIAELAGLDRAWADGQIDTGADADAARRLAFEAMRTRARPAVDNRSPHVTVGADHGDPTVMRRAMSDALAHRLAPGAVKLEGQATEFRSMPALAMFGRLAGARGERLDPWDREGIMTRALGGGHTSSDFPLLLADAANKVLLAQYSAAAPTYRQIAGQKSLKDFKAHNFLRLGDFPVFKPLAEKGTVEYGTIGENREQVKAQEFATGIIIGREALINDDLSALSDFSSLIAVRAAQFENGKVYALIISLGPVMSDGKTLFHADHGNLAAAGTSIAAGIDAAVLAFRTQTGLDGARINVSPKFLVVGPRQEVAARRLLATINPVQASDVNPWAGQFTLIVDAEITDTRGLLAADPAQVPTLVFGYVAGAQGPQIKTETDFDTQAVKVRAGLDFAAGAIDFRGFYLNTGA